MLVLTRRTDQRIVIGDGIELVVLAVQGSRVRLGIQAPQKVSITRSGLADVQIPRTLPGSVVTPDLCSMTDR